MHTKQKSHTLRLGYFKMPIKNKCSTEKSYPDPDDLHPKIINKPRQWPTFVGIILGCLATMHAYDASTQEGSKELRKAARLQIMWQFQDISGNPEFPSPNIVQVTFILFASGSAWKPCSFLCMLQQGPRRGQQCSYNKMPLGLT